VQRLIINQSQLWAHRSFLFFIIMSFLLGIPFSLILKNIKIEKDKPIINRNYPWNLECFVEDLFLGGQWSIILGYRRLSVKSLLVLSGWLLMTERQPSNLKKQETYY